MSLKQQTATPAPLRTLAKEDPFTGPWGDMVAPGQSVLTVRLHTIDPENNPIWYGYPYRMISHWLWEKAPEEILKVLVPGGSVLVHGHGLKALFDALCEGRLKTVIESKKDDDTAKDGEIYVNAIEIVKTDPKKLQ